VFSQRSRLLIVKGVTEDVIIFENNMSWKEAVKNFLKFLTTTFYSEGMKKLTDNWSKFSKNQSHYLEQQDMFMIILSKLHCLSIYLERKLLPSLLSCTLVDGYRIFERRCCFHRQCRRVNSTLKIVSVHSFWTSVTVYRTSRCHQQTVFIITTVRASNRLYIEWFLLNVLWKNRMELVTCLILFIQVRHTS
jgi:hypothetical protein